ncbi:MAG: BACON domain-containing protein [Prevotella sp.]|nr:BACON domain-containing protein [Prevotella sp.]
MIEMMKKTTIFLLMMVAFVACGGGDDDDADTGKKPDYIAANEEMTLSDTKENILSIKSNCKWNLSPDVDWLFLDPASGEGNGKVTITASPNKTDGTRSGIIYMRNETNTVERTVVVYQKRAAENSFVPLPGENPFPE